MTIVSLASFKEVRGRKEAEERRWRKRSCYRYIGGRVHMAHYYHSCDRCIFPISPGDQYRRDVYVNNVRYSDRKKHLRVEKIHWPQCYGPSEEEDRQMREEIERQREAEREAKRKAA